MIEINPSQFIEALLETQRANSMQNTLLQVRMFNDMADRLLALDIRTRFGFFELVEFAKHFADLLPYKDHTLEVSYNETLFSAIRKYNRIYNDIDQFKQINQVWKDSVK